MSTCAVVQGNLVVNLIIAEPTDTPPDNCTLVLIPANVFVTIGFTYDGSSFIDFDGNPSLPVDPPVEEISLEEISLEEIPLEVPDGS
jgi:hypothetical protein